jgi:hypothetical protein
MCHLRAVLRQPFFLSPSFSGSEAYQWPTFAKLSLLLHSARHISEFQEVSARHSCRFVDQVLRAQTMSISQESTNLPFLPSSFVFLIAT